MFDSQIPSLYIMICKVLFIILFCQSCPVKDSFHRYGLGNSSLFLKNH